MDDEAKLLSCETEPFINNYTADDAPRKRLSYLHSLNKVPHLVPHGILCILLSLNIIWAILNVRGERPICFEKPTLYEPNGAPLDIKEVQWSLRLGSRSPYTSFDRTISDAAWQNLSIGSNRKSPERVLRSIPSGKCGSFLIYAEGWLKLPKEKLEQIGQMAPDRVGFADGSGYLLGMDVFHQLHCLNYLRKKTILYHGIYPESAPDEIPADIHIPHCIDSIRLSLQCHSDMSLIPQRWADGWLEPWSVWTTKHQCRDFSKIREWAHTQQPFVGAGSLIHPQLGPVSSGHLNISALPVYSEEMVDDSGF